MQLVIRHQTIYRYEGIASRVAMLLKLMPSDHAGQKVVEWDVTVNDQPVPHDMRNGHGDLEGLWVRHDRLDSATIVAAGVIETSDTTGIIRDLAHQPNPLVYLRETALTQPTAQMREAGEGVVADTLLERLHAISAMIRERIDYRAGATESRTSAAQSWALGAGVCQDHAQIFISILRAIGVPARYVSGYLLASTDQSHVYETHAWAEAWVEGLGWVGFDISNGVCVTDHYVRIACGMDAHEAAPVRGQAAEAGAISVEADVRIADMGKVIATPGETEIRQQQQ